MDKENYYVLKSIRLAIRDLFEEDSQLLILDVNERSITHKLAHYLDHYFNNWNVDCEYNRNHNDSKTLSWEIEEVKTDDTHARTVYPDIIVHKRDTEENFIVIEVKKSTNPKNNNSDMSKLKAFKSELGYKYAFFIRLRTGTQNFGLDTLCEIT